MLVLAQGYPGRAVGVWVEGSSKVPTKPHTSVTCSFLMLPATLETDWSNCSKEPQLGDSIKDM